MAQAAIAKVHGRRVWDSRGRPTVEVEVALAGGIVGRAIAPAGASTGSGEAVDLRDGGAAFGGLDVRRAVANVNDEIAPALAGRDAGATRPAIDGHLIALDGTPAKARLGGNAIVATSMAVLQAAAASHAEPLWRYLAQGGEVAIPVPEIQIFGGGAHAARRVDVQDFMVVCAECVVLRRGARPHRRGLSRRRANPRRARARPGRCRRGRLVAGLRRRTRRRSTCSCGRSSGPALRPATRSRSRSTSPPPSSAAAGATGSHWSSASSTPTA